MPSNGTTGIAGYQAAFIGGVVLHDPPMVKQAELLLRTNPGLIDKTLDAMVLEYLAEFTDLFGFIPAHRHAEFVRWWVQEKPSIKSMCNRLQDAARAMRREQELDGERERGW